MDVGRCTGVVWVDSALVGGKRRNETAPGPTPVRGAGAGAVCRRAGAVLLLCCPAVPVGEVGDPGDERGSVGHDVAGGELAAFL
ncbi:hypothetical protein [Streptomyces sp. NPDC056304]|uniref:hypothetical protein n=1 Tax=Streptomyces sp. NPDC056304 TaxID=3345778 RepID=UPI0035DE2B12